MLIVMIDYTLPRKVLTGGTLSKSPSRSANMQHLRAGCGLASYAAGSGRKLLLLSAEVHHSFCHLRAAFQRSPQCCSPN